MSLFTKFSYFSMECFSIIEVVTKSRDSLLITAPVLVPGEMDCEFIYGEEPLTEGQIRQIAHEYLANYSLVDSFVKLCFNELIKHRNNQI